MGLVARVGYPKVPLLTFPSRQDVKMAKVEELIRPRRSDPLPRIPSMAIDRLTPPVQSGS